MVIEKLDKFIGKVSKYVGEDSFTEQEVDQKIEEIEKRIQSLDSVSKKEKKNIEKKLNSGEEVVKQIDESNSNKRYVIRYFYNKKYNKLFLKDIFECELENKKSYICIDFIITLYTVLFLFFIANSNKNNSGNFWPIVFFGGSIFINAWTFWWYRKEKNNRYKIVGQDWLDKLLLDLDSLEKIEKFRISRVVLFFLLFLIYPSFFINNSVVWYLATINAVCYICSIWMFIDNLFKLTKFNFLYFVAMVLFSILIGGLRSTNWAAITALIAIIGLLFSDEIWKINPNYENPLEGRYKSKSNKKIVERNIFKYKLILSIISLILFVTLKLLEQIQSPLIGRLLLGEQVKKLNAIGSIMYEGLDRIAIAFLLFIAYLVIVEFRKRKITEGKEFEKPIVDSIVKFIYKDLKLSDPEVKTSIKIDKDLQKIFEPKTLIKNLDDLPNDIIVSMEKPVKSGENILFIQEPDGQILLKKTVKIEFY